MAAITVNAVVAEVQASFGEAPSAEIVTAMNKVDRFLSALIRLRAEEYTLTLTASDSTYTLSDSVVRVWSARYERSATAQDSYTLKQTDISEMDLKRPGWRSWQDAEPKYFMLDVDNVGAYNIILAAAPISSTSSSYPNVKVYASIGGTLAAGGNLPAKIQQSDVYRFGACYYYSIDHFRDQTAYWKSLYDAAVQAEINLEMGREVQQKPSFYVPGPSGGVI